MSSKCEILRRIPHSNNETLKIQQMIYPRTHQIVIFKKNY